MTNSLIKRIHEIKESFQTSIGKSRKTSDFERWGTEKNLSADWDLRTQQIAKLIEPGTSVIEFGAGRLILKASLPNSCTYTPSDLVDRGHGTVVCDLNGDNLPKLQEYDIAVFSGVLEYVYDVPSLISHLSSFVDVIVASYAVTDLNKANRSKHGWVNEYSSAQIIALFENAGYLCDHSETWQKQLIYRFRKDQTSNSGNLAT